MLTHDFLDRFRRLIRVVEWNSGYIMVENMGLDNTVEHVASDEAKFTVDGCGGSTDIGPRFTLVVGEGGVGVLEEGDGN